MTSRHPDSSLPRPPAGAIVLPDRAHRQGVPGRRAFALILVLAALASAIVVVHARSASRLTFRLDDKKAHTGEWLTRPTPFVLRASDGSEIRLTADSVVKITSTGREGADVTLASGSLSLSLAGAAWHLVMGSLLLEPAAHARLDLSWGPAGGALAVTAGVVRVTGRPQAASPGGAETMGGCGPAPAIAVAAGQRQSWTCLARAAGRP